MILEKNSGYGSLYRKCRPQRFQEIIGQSHIITSLRKQVETGNIAHAYLFSGSRGTGKTSTALVLAKAINCLNPQNGEPCLECVNCTGETVDIIEMDAASHNSVDDIRELREFVKYAPARGKKKVYIIDEVHMLSNAAFNALLKTLEEPPAHIVFILATTELHMIPATVQSRCQRFDFKRVSKEGMRNKILEISTKYGVKVDDSAVELIMRIADGSMRDTLALLEQCLSLEKQHLAEDEVASFFGTARSVDLIDVLESALNKNTLRLVESLEGLFGAGIDVLEFLSGLIRMLRDLMVYRITGKTSGIAAASAFKEIHSLADAEILFRKLVDVSKFLRYSKNKESIVEVTLIAFSMRGGARTEVPAPAVVTPASAETVGVPPSPEGAKPETSPTAEVHAPAPMPRVTPASDGAKMSASGTARDTATAKPTPRDDTGGAIRQDPHSGEAGEANTQSGSGTKTYIPRTKKEKTDAPKKTPQELREIWEQILERIPEEKRQLLKNSRIGLFVGGEMIVHVAGLSKAREMVVEMRVKADAIRAAKEVTGADCVVKFEAVEREDSDSEADAQRVKAYFEEKGLSVEITS